MEKTLRLKESEDRRRFILPLEFSGDFADDEKIKILKLYFQEMLSALLSNKTEEEFLEDIKDIFKSNGYNILQTVSKTLTYSWDIHGPLHEMMMLTASEFIKSKPHWPPNLAAAMILCSNVLEVVVNNRLIEKFEKLGRKDKVTLVKEEKKISVGDKLTWLLNDAFNRSLKDDNTLWTWFLDINTMRNKIVHCKENSLEKIEIEAKANHGHKTKLSEAFVTEAITYTRKILIFLEKLL